MLTSRCALSATPATWHRSTESPPRRVRGVFGGGQRHRSEITRPQRCPRSLRLPPPQQKWCVLRLDRVSTTPLLFNIHRRRLLHRRQDITSFPTERTSIPPAHASLMSSTTEQSPYSKLCARHAPSGAASLKGPLAESRCGQSPSVLTHTVHSEHALSAETDDATPQTTLYLM